VNRGGRSLPPEISAEVHRPRKAGLSRPGIGCELGIPVANGWSLFHHSAGKLRAQRKASHNLRIESGGP
jgi:hypothetical protein